MDNNGNICENADDCGCCDECMNPEPCFHCGGKGTIIICVDDMCRNNDSCMHGDGEIICPECNGEG